jgi:hypothetical protein
MGHNSWNLVREPALKSFSGIILSPVNNNSGEMSANLVDLGELRGGLDVVFDPQFYKPKSDRGSLPTWNYFNGEFETVDLSDLKWWENRCLSLVQEATLVGASSIASPAFLPRAFDLHYYDWVVNCAELLNGMVDSNTQSCLVTAIVRVPELAQSGAPERIASILTRTKIARIYLVLYDDSPPREQRTDFEALAGAISLIRQLESAGSKVLVTFSGLDMLLWKAAGATSVATGKFFNLRRFTPGRWDDPSEGGRVLPYWTDEALLTWLREADIRLLLRLDLVDVRQARANPYSQAILDLLAKGEGDPWVALGWKQYLHWFAQLEPDISSKKVDVRNLLESADRQWTRLQKRGALLFDRTNDGSWVRSWLNALLLA